MISLRSKNEVISTLENLGLHPVTVDICEIEIEESLTQKHYEVVRSTLHKNDFEIIQEREHILLEKISALIIQMVHYSEEFPSTTFSNYISKTLHYNYTYLSKLFSRLKKITIEQFIIAHKVERVKQLLLFNELTLSEIAWKLNYSSTAHLCAQFKRITGLTPTVFKKSENKNLVALEDLLPTPA